MKTHYLPLQPFALENWQHRYRCLNNSQEISESNIDTVFERLANTLASVEATEPLRQHWAEQFLYALQSGALPSERILMNIGAGNTQIPVVNAVASATIEDSFEDIFLKLHEASLSVKAGCVIGYDFSTLRPSNASIQGRSGSSVGPLAFMTIYDQMASFVHPRQVHSVSLSVSHPDVMAFIQAKKQLPANIKKNKAQRSHTKKNQTKKNQKHAVDFKQSNVHLSLLLSDAFMESLRHNTDWHLYFPISEQEALKYSINFIQSDNVIWREWINHNGLLTNQQHQVACKIEHTVNAQTLWNAIMEANEHHLLHDCVLIDRVNEYNNNWWCETIHTANIADEMPLPDYGSCVLGTINLAVFIEAPFTDRATFNQACFKRVLKIFVRMLDNVVELNQLPLEEQQEELFYKRRHGIGFIGLGSALTMLGIRYGSAEAIEFAENISRELALIGWQEALALAKEKGCAPLLAEEYTVTATMLKKRPEMYQDGYQVGDRVRGSILHAKYSRYMQQIAQIDSQLIDDLAHIGARFTHHSAIVSAASIAASIANNVSDGIEPSTKHYYVHVSEDNNINQKPFEVYSYELLLYQAQVDPDIVIDEALPTSGLPDYFVIPELVTPLQHLEMQVAIQKWIDSSVTKKIVVPEALSVQGLRETYLYAHEKNLKNCSLLRVNLAQLLSYSEQNEDAQIAPNPSIKQSHEPSSEPVPEIDYLRESYVFTLADGSTMVLKADEQVEYEGQLHYAADLFMVLKEHYSD